MPSSNFKLFGHQGLNFYKTPIVNLSVHNGDTYNIFGGCSGLSWTPGRLYSSIFGCGCGCGCGFGGLNIWNGLGALCGGILGGLMNGFMAMPFMNYMSFMPYSLGMGQNWLNAYNARNNSNSGSTQVTPSNPGTPATSTTHATTQVVETTELDNMINDLDGKTNPEDFQNAINKLESLKVTLPEADYNNKLREILTKAKTAGITELTIDGNSANVANKLSGLNAPPVTPATTNDNLDQLDLTAEKITALRALGITGVQLPYQNKPWGVSIPTDFTVAKLTELKNILSGTGIPVALAHNDQATYDPWIAGEIDDIQEVDGKIKFTIDCKNSGKVGYKYEVTQKESVGTSYHIKCITPQNGIKIGATPNPNGVDYTLGTGRMNRNAEPLVSVDVNTFEANN